MGALSSVVKIGAVVAVAEVVRREMRKPENQEKVRVLVGRVQDKVRDVTR